MIYKEIETLRQFEEILQYQKNFTKYAFQNIDFIKIKKEIKATSFSQCIFLGCKLPKGLLIKLQPDNFIFPQLDVPYNCYPAKLYSINFLYSNYKLGKPESYNATFDSKIYEHYIKTGKEALSINETLARRLHDHAITDAMYDFLANYPEKKVVAVMGGHALNRTEDSYGKIAELSKMLCEKGFLMVTGGGPGAMEATHLGAWFAGRNKDDLSAAIKLLISAPNYKHENWLDTAFQVIEKFPRTNKFESLGIPTWLYGHEPATPFATKIAKYFANSVREDGLLTIAKGGIVFSPGSAGTVQEIFQDATQNHYLSFGYSSPMIFFNKKFWEDEFPVYPFLKQSANSGKYKNLLLSIADDINEIVNKLEHFSS